MDASEAHRRALEAYKRAADVAREAKRRRPLERPGYELPDGTFTEAWRMGDREFAWVAIHAFLEAAMEDETRLVVRDALRTLAEGRPLRRDRLEIDGEGWAG